MLQRHENLIKMGSTWSDTRLNTLIMSSLPPSYRPTLQTITAAERASALTGTTPKRMKPNDLIDFLIEEAQHRVIIDKRSKNSNQALAANARKGNKGKSRRDKREDKPKQDGNEVTCSNCHKPRHTSENCYAKGGGKEGQGPRQKAAKAAQAAKAAKTETTVVAIA